MENKFLNGIYENNFLNNIYMEINGKQTNF